MAHCRIGGGGEGTGGNREGEASTGGVGSVRDPEGSWR